MSYTEKKVEHEEVKKLVRELRKLIPNHKFRTERGLNNGIVVDEKITFYRNFGETLEDLKSKIISCYQEKVSA